MAFAARARLQYRCGGKNIAKITFFTHRRKAFFFFFCALFCSPAKFAVCALANRSPSATKKHTVSAFGGEFVRHRETHSRTIPPSGVYGSKS